MARETVGRAAALVTALGLVAALGSAQEQTTPPGAVHEDTSEQSAEGEEDHPRNALGIVLGGTYESEEDDTYFTLGFEYERILNRRVGLLVGVEHINEIDAWVLVVPLVYRHESGARLYVGPGLELKTRRPEREGEHEGGPDASVEAVDPLPRQENLFLWRFGAGWTFEVHESYAFSPTVNLDLVREHGRWVEAVVFTLSVGFDF